MVAQDKGFYRDAGLNVRLIRGGPNRNSLEWLEQGKTTFCTAWLSTAVEELANGANIVNIAQMIQRSALLLVANRHDGIYVPKDLDGKSVGLWMTQFYLQPMLFFRQNNLTVNIVPNYSSVGLFLKGGVDAIAAMWYNEYHTILNSGFNPDELTVFFMHDHGLDFPEDGIYCTEKTYLKDPRMCYDFACASIKGWLYAFEHKEEALDIVMKYARAAHTRTNRPHQRWMLNRMEDLIIPGGDKSRIGKLNYGACMKLARALRNLHLIEKVPAFAYFFRGPE